MPSVTLTFSGAHALRIQAALEAGGSLVDEDGNPRPATVADLKEHIIKDVAKFVRNSEQRAARQAADSGVSWVDIT